MNYVEYFNLLGVDAKQIPSITGEGAPTTATEGAVGCFYMDTLTGDMYRCTSVSGDAYTWIASLSMDRFVSDSFAQIGCVATSFTVPAGVTHSSTIDRVPVDIKQGETYHVRFTYKSKPNAAKLFEIGADGVETGISGLNVSNVANTTTTSLVATKNIKEIGLYVSNTGVASDNEIELLVYADNTVFSEHIKNKANEENKAALEAVRDTLAKVGYNNTVFSVLSGNTHSSNVDGIAVDIKQGEAYTVIVNVTPIVYNLGFSIYEIGDDGQGAKVFNGLAQTSRYAAIATKDVKKIGVYVGTVTKDVSFSVCVLNEKTDFTENIKSQAVDESKDLLGSFMEFDHTKNPQRYGFGYNAYLNPVLGTLDPDDGSEIESPDRLRSDFVIVLKPVYYEFSTTAKVRVFKYNLDETFVSADVWRGNITGWLPSGYKYRFIFSNNEWTLPTREEVLHNVKLWCYGKDEYESKDFLLSEVTDTVNKAEEEKELSFSFALFTDAHIPNTNGHWRDTVLSLANVNDLYPLDAIFSLGDTINGDIPLNESKEILKRVREDLIGISSNSFILTGNHDTNDFYDKTNHTDRMSVADRYSLYGRYTNAKVAKNGVSNYGYYDIDSLKIRVIILDVLDSDTVYGINMSDMGYSNEQVEWVSKVALDTDYQVIFLSHTGVTKEFNYNTVQPMNGVELRNVIEAFIEKGGIVIGMFHGHTHWDYIGKNSETNGFFEVSTGAANCSGSVPSNVPTDANIPAREPNTVTQELWDLVIVKPLSRTVKMIRFGAGDDRQFSY